MNDTEKTARILRVIAYLLCAILLMEVILFAGITSFASVENYFIPSEAYLNSRLNSSMSIVASVNSYNFVTNTIEIPTGATYIYIKSPNSINIAGNNTKFVLTDSVDGGSGSIFYMATSNKSYLGDYVYRFDISAYADGTVVPKYTYIIFNIQFESSTGLQNVTLQDVQDIKINFTGDFTEEEPTQATIFGLYSDFTQGMPNIITNLLSLLYNENGLTAIGISLCVMGGFGTVCAMIKIILKLFQRGK